MQPRAGLPASGQPEPAHAASGPPSDPAGGGRGCADRADPSVHDAEGGRRLPDGRGAPGCRARGERGDAVGADPPIVVFSPASHTTTPAAAPNRRYRCRSPGCQPRRDHTRAAARPACARMRGPMGSTGSRCWLAPAAHRELDRGSVEDDLATRRCARGGGHVDGIPPRHAAGRHPPPSRSIRSLMRSARRATAHRVARADRLAARRRAARHRRRHR